tara:strand:- start:3092 stop:3868 length:777 start_codon:yes stop_codon:yes gene_type:complete
MSLDDPRPLLLADPIADGLALRTLPFDTRTFSNDDFARHGIALPSSLNRAGRSRRCEYLAGRRCAHSALASLGCGQADVVIGPDGAPDWPPGFSGSISHSSSWAAAVVTATGGLRPGIDCESIIDASAFGDMAERVATRTELDSAERLLGDRCLALTLVFSAKESAYKSLPIADRRGCDFLSFRVVLAGNDSASFQVFDARPYRGACIGRGLYTHLNPTSLLTLVVSRAEPQGGPKAITLAASEPPALKTRKGPLRDE